ncbi:MAG TPA: glucosyltransferase domain-containing protein [Xenococcaceae cyanobacterium]
MFSRKLKSKTYRLYKEYAGVLALLIVLQIITYSYFFTLPIFTDHTFPNGLIMRYPSYMTQMEGRWLADFINLLQGRSGVQSFQMYVAVMVQSINGILFARFLGLKKPLEVLLAGAFVCLYPAFLDNYSFNKDHIAYTVGDTLALLGILYCKNTVNSAKNAIISSFFFMLTLACYQPKIGFIGLLCICYLILYITDSNKNHLFSFKDTLGDIAYIFCVFFGGCLLYYVSIKFTITINHNKTNINSISEILIITFRSYDAFFRYHTVESDYLPKLLRFLPALGISLGYLSLLQKAKRRKNLAAVTLVTALLLLIPIVLRLPWIINKFTPENVGRTNFANGYALLFFLSSALKLEWLNLFVRWILTGFIYFFIIVGTQETNAAAFKSMYDLNMINRIVSRIETVADEVYQKRYALVVIGYYEDFRRSRYVKAPNKKNMPGVSRFAFPHYQDRQIQILNHFFFGKNVFRSPTVAQQEKAIASAKERRPWPAKESVYLLDDDIVVLLLEKYSDKSKVTQTSDK